MNWLYSFVVILVFARNSLESSDYTDEIITNLCENFAIGKNTAENPLEFKANSGNTRIFNFTNSNSTKSTFPNLFEPINSINQGKCLQTTSILNKVSELQTSESKAFNIGFLAKLDLSLETPLEIGTLATKTQLNYGFTHSKSYKKEFDKITTENFTIFKVQCQYSLFQLNLKPISHLKFNQDFLDDLEKAAKMNPKKGGQYIIDKYGSMYLQSGIVGGIFKRYNYVLQSDYKLMNSHEKELANQYYVGYWSAGNELEKSMKKKSSTFSLNSTADVAVYGGDRMIRNLSNSDFSKWVDTVKEMPAITEFNFQPISNLISNAVLKKEVKKIIRVQLLKSLALRKLDTDFFSLKWETIRDYKFQFPNIVEYALQTRKQMERLVEKDANALADPRVSPFIKMDALAKAMEFAVSGLGDNLRGMYHHQLDSTFAKIRRCHDNDDLLDWHQANNILSAIVEMEEWASYFHNRSVSFKKYDDVNTKEIRNFKKYEKMVTKLRQTVFNLDRIIQPQINTSFRYYLDHCNDRSF